MMLLRFLQLLIRTLNIILTFGDIRLNGIYLLSLRKNQGRQLIEQLHALINRRLKILYIPEFILYITHRILQCDTSLSV